MTLGRCPLLLSRYPSQHSSFPSSEGSQRQAGRWLRLTLFFSSLLTSDLSKSDQLLTTHRSPLTCDQNLTYIHPEKTNTTPLIGPCPCTFQSLRVGVEGFGLRTSDLECMVYGVWCMVYGVWCMVYGVWYMVYGVWCMV